MLWIDGVKFSDESVNVWILSSHSTCSAWLTIDRYLEYLTLIEKNGSKVSTLIEKNGSKVSTLVVGQL
jgi:hypothetical protein